jgi:hypothetical protein
MKIGWARAFTPDQNASLASGRCGSLALDETLSGAVSEGHTPWGSGPTGMRSEILDLSRAADTPAPVQSPFSPPPDEGERTVPVLAKLT